MHGKSDKSSSKKPSHEIARFAKKRLSLDLPWKGNRSRSVGPAWQSCEAEHYRPNTALDIGIALTGEKHPGLRRIQELEHTAGTANSGSRTMAAGQKCSGAANRNSRTKTGTLSKDQPAMFPDKRSRTPEDEFSAWLAKYGPVERKIIEDRARRLANRENRRRAKARAFGGLCEATEGLAVVWRREGWSLREMLRWADGDVLTLSALAKWMRHDATKTIDRIRCRLRRPVYYASEKARRLALAEERRRIGGRRTTNPCPTKESILDAWIHRRDSHEAAVRFGSMIHDLECYVDNSLLRDEYGAIIGRNGGVKAWLYENIPALHLRYGTVMRYKAMAKKLKQITDLPDPVPAEAVLGEMPHEAAEGAQIDIPDANMTAGNGEGRGGASRAIAGNDAKAGNLNAVQTDKAYGKESGTRFPADGQTANAPSLAIVRARAVWLEVENGIRGSVEALMDRIDALTDPSRVEDAAMLLEWKAKYAGEITERAKTSWWRRMAKTRAV